jgi:hypothetical protein
MKNKDLRVKKEKKTLSLFANEPEEIFSLNAFYRFDSEDRLRY